MSDLQNCVLIVEDEFIIAYALGLEVAGMGLAVCGKADTAKDAIAMAAIHRPKVILMDTRLKGDMDGVDVALAIRATLKSRIIFLTGSRDSAAMARIRSAEPFTVLSKPATNKQITSAISDAMFS